MELSLQEISSSSVILPKTENPYKDSIHINTFRQLDFSLKREYAEYFDLPNAESLTDDEICGALMNNEWVPAIEDHVWIPASNLKGMTVSHNIKDLELWRDAQLIFELERGDRYPSAIQIYNDLRQRWEKALLEVDEYRESLDRKETNKTSDISLQNQPMSMPSIYSTMPTTNHPGHIQNQAAGPSHVEDMSPAQIRLLSARRDIVQDKTYYEKRRRPLIVDGVAFGDLTRLDTSKPNPPNRTQRSTTPIIIIPPESPASKFEEPKSLIPFPDAQAGRSNTAAVISPQNQSDIGHSKFSALQECMVGELPELLEKSESSKPQAESTKTPARILNVTEGGIEISEPMPSFASSLRCPEPHVAFDDSDEQPTRQQITSNGMDVMVQKSGPASACAASESRASPPHPSQEAIQADTPKVPESILRSLEAPYGALGSRERLLTRQYATWDVLEGNRTNSGDWAVFIEGFQSIIAEASQAVRNQTQSLLSNLRSLFGVGKSPLKRTFEDNGQEPDGNELSSPQADAEPSTPSRKKARYGESPYDTLSNSIASERLLIPLTEGGNVPSNADCDMSDAGTSSGRTDRKENIPDSKALVRRLTGVLQNSGSKYKDKDVRASPRRSTRIAKSSPRRSPRNSGTGKTS